MPALPGSPLEAALTGFHRVDVLADQFDTLLQQKGYNLTWEKSTLCPCVDVNGKSEVTCSLCGGKSFFYFDPIEIKGLITGLNVLKGFADVGEHGDWILGKASLTVPSEHRIAFRDRVTNKDSLLEYSQLIVHEGLPSTKDTLRYPALAVRILRTKTKQFVEDVDFRIAGDGKIEWISTGTRPKRDEVYTILYTCHPVWIALDGMHQVRDTTLLDPEDGNNEVFRRLPRQMIISLEYYFNPTAGSSS